MWSSAFWSALSTYSTIPVPQVPWRPEGLRYTLCFFPVVGVFCAAALAGWTGLCCLLDVPSLLYAAGAVVLPLLLTGGIHLDGAMDTVDALAAHQDRARSLEILKDPHCGAFAIVFCCGDLLLCAGLFDALFQAGLAWAVCPGYVLSRALSALAALHLPKARKQGMLASMTQQPPGPGASVLLGLAAGAALLGMLLLAPLPGAVAGGLALLWLWRYRGWMGKVFGGVTGDTAGFFLQLCEGFLLLGLWIGGVVG